MTLTRFLVGLPAMLLCLALQAALTFWCVRFQVRQVVRPSGRQNMLFGLRRLVIAMLAMMAGNLLQIVMWSMLFVLLGEFTERYEAIHHSAVNFTSLGYGDFVMSKAWKLLAPLEAVNGVLMLGMTAAALMAILPSMIKTQQETMHGRKCGG